MQSNSHKKSAKTVHSSRMNLQEKRVRHIEQNICSLRMSIDTHLRVSLSEMVEDKKNAEHWKLISENAKYIANMYLELENIRRLR